jgi:hypothetical protein
MCICEKTAYAAIIIAIAVLVYLWWPQPAKPEFLFSKKPSKPSQAEILQEVAAVKAKITDLELLIGAKAQTLNVMQVWDRDIAKKELRALEDEHAAYVARYAQLRAML